MKYKKGQIIPIWVGVTASDKKSQHKIKFGADVSIEGGTIFLESEGSAIVIPYDMSRLMKNGTRKKVITNLGFIPVDGSRVLDSAMITVGIK